MLERKKCICLQENNIYNEFIAEMMSQSHTHKLIDGLVKKS